MIIIGKQLDTLGEILEYYDIFDSGISNFIYQTKSELFFWILFYLICNMSIKKNEVYRQRDKIVSYTVILNILGTAFILLTSVILLYKKLISYNLHVSYVNIPYIDASLNYTGSSLINIPLFLIFKLASSYCICYSFENFLYYRNMGIHELKSKTACLIKLVIYSTLIVAIWHFSLYELDEIPRLITLRTMIMIVLVLVLFRYLSAIVKYMNSNVHILNDMPIISAFIMFFISNLLLLGFVSFSSWDYSIISSVLSYYVDIKIFGIMFLTLFYVKEIVYHLIEKEKELSILVDNNKLIVQGISHELKSPLFGLGTLLKQYHKKIEKLLQQEEQSEQCRQCKNRKFLKKLYQSMETDLLSVTARMSKILTNVTEYGRRLRDDEIKPQDLRKLIREAVMFAKFSDNKKQIKSNQIVFIDMTPRLDAVSNVSSTKVVQIIQNLLANAIDAVLQKMEVLDDHTKYEPYIAVKLKVTRDFNIVSVHDNGIGMDEAQIGRCYEKFYTTKKHGSGLGLFLVKQYMEEVSGYVIVSSKKMDGTIIQLHFPVWKGHRKNYKKQRASPRLRTNLDAIIKYKDCVCQAEVQDISAHGAYILLKNCLGELNAKIGSTVVIMIGGKTFIGKIVRKEKKEYVAVSFAKPDNDVYKLVLGEDAITASPITGEEQQIIIPRLDEDIVLTPLEKEGSKDG